MSDRKGRAAEAARLQAEGHNGLQIAEIMGISRSYAYSLLNDPGRSKDLARKRSYGGTCEICGEATYGGNGPERAPKRCHTHSEGPRLAAAVRSAKSAPRREAIIAAWNAGESSSAIAERFGYRDGTQVCQAVGVWRYRGYDVAHRRTPEQVERISARWRVAA